MPRNITITFSDGTSHVYQNAPDEVTPDQVEARASKEFGKKVTALDGGRGAAASTDEPFPVKLGRQVIGAAAGLGAGAGQVAMGAQELAGRGLAAVGLDKVGGWLKSDAIAGRAKLAGEIAPFKADAPFAAGAGELAGEIIPTLPVGGLIAKGLGALPGVASAAPNLLNAIRTGGMVAGQGGNALAQLGTRAAGGAITGGASAALVDPNSAGMGAVIGGALPVLTKTAGLVGQGAGKAARAVVGDVSPEVSALAQRAKALGIDIPVDRLTNSKPLNAVAASLNYVPLSGRAGTEEKMMGSMNKALSRTFGQDSENVTMALRKASGDLGQQFDTVLQANTVKMTPAFKAALADAENQATNELGNEAASIIHKQIAQLQTKGASGEIDGQAAYNIKKALDRIGAGNSDAAFYARDLKKKLMDALNESLGPTEAAAFGKVRQQYGNMLALENLAQNGAEGGVSVGRLANLKNINNPDLQELADIAAQFVRSRESPHGAAQRIAVGSTAGLASAASIPGALPAAIGAMGGARAINSALNSNMLKNAAMGVRGQPNALQRLLSDSDLAQLGYRVTPALAAGR